MSNLLQMVKKNRHMFIQFSIYYILPRNIFKILWAYVVAHTEIWIVKNEIIS